MFKRLNLNWKQPRTTFTNKSQFRLAEEWFWKQIKENTYISILNSWIRWSLRQIWRSSARKWTRYHFHFHFYQHALTFDQHCLMANKHLWICCLLFNRFSQKRWNMKRGATPSMRSNVKLHRSSSSSASYIDAIKSAAIPLTKALSKETLSTRIIIKN